MMLEEEQNQFYQALGQAVAQWGHVEHALFEVYCRFMQSPDWAIASGSFYGVVSFGAKLAITNGAAQRALKDISETTEWTELKKDVQERSSERSRLVHRVVVTDIASDEKAGRRVYLTTPLLNVTAFMTKKDKSTPGDLYLEDILAYTPKFGRLSQRLFEYAHKLEKQLKQL